MLVTVYKLIHQSSWYISLDTRAEGQFWPESATFLVFSKRVPLSYAYQWLSFVEKQHTNDWQPLLAACSRRFTWDEKLVTDLTVLEVRQMADTLPSKEKFYEQEWLTMCNLLVGRSLSVEELKRMLADCDCPNALRDWRYYVQVGYLRERIKCQPGIRDSATVKRHCARCGAAREWLKRSRCSACGTQCEYCEQCLSLGRIRQCSLLLVGLCAGPRSVSNQMSEQHMQQQWGLTTPQARAAQKALDFLAQPTQGGSDFVVWAVTGAGKTEMMFPLLSSALDDGLQVALVIPRRDVVLELLPRITNSFSAHGVQALYGGAPELWPTAPLLLATTHQMLRFQQKFDMMIIDEMDAFPYHNNPMLQFAVSKALKPGGKAVWLTATPPSELRRRLQSGQLPYAMIPVRYHRHPLPEPVFLRGSSIDRLLQPKHLTGRFEQSLRKSLNRGASIFVFVPLIARVMPLVARLQSLMPGVQVDGTSAKDSQRASKVESFRQRTIRVLVTTTILERGVTVPFADVYILDADCSLFDAAALIQMAGRAGRSAKDPHGNVYFCAKEWTHAQQDAAKQIQTMNRIARREGYLHV